MRTWSLALSFAAVRIAAAADPPARAPATAPAAPATAPTAPAALAASAGAPAGPAGPGAGGSSDPFGEHYRRAETLYEAGQFAESIRELRAAYQIRPLPRLLLNIGQLHLKLDQPQSALSAYQAYLLAEPRMTEDVRATIEEGSARARALIADQEHALFAERERERERERVRAALAVQKEPPPRAPLHRRWWFWTGMGVIAAGAVTGIALGATRPWLNTEPGDLQSYTFTFPPTGR